MTLPDWRDLPRGGVIHGSGTAVQYRTGAWRTERPVVDMDRCTHCLFCWLFCPDGSVETAGGRFVGIDLEHCKGCGICAAECPPKAIQLAPEVQSLADGAL